MQRFRFILPTLLVLAAVTGCNDSSTDAKVQEQGDLKTPTPEPSATVDTAPETGSGGEQQTGQPEQPKPTQ